MNPKYERYINKKIIEGKKRIEEWYNEIRPNYCLIFGIEYDNQSQIDSEQLKKEYEQLDKENEKEYEQFIFDQVAEKHLSQLKIWKSKREKIYRTFEKNDPLLLLEFLDLINEFPDIVYKKRITRKRTDRSKISLERDYINSEKRKAAKLYKEAVQKIENCVNRENEKLFNKYHGNRLYPISVTIYNPYGEVEKINHRPPEKQTAFIKAVSNLLIKEFVKPIDRAKFIGKILKYFYGLPDSAIDLRTISKHC